MVKSFVLYIFILLTVITAGCGCQHTISLDNEDRERADKLVKSLTAMEKRFGSIDKRLKAINTNAHKLRGELAGVRKGTQGLQKQLEALRKQFFGSVKK